MTEREMKRLNELLKKKEEQEKHDRDFFREVRKRRTEVLRELGIKNDEKKIPENNIIFDDYFEQDDK